MKELWPQIILFLGISTLILIIPNKNLITFNLAVLIPILLVKLLGEKPVFKEYLKVIITTICYVTIIYYLVTWLGAYGVLGLILIIGLFVAWRIYKGWSLFMYTTDWGADVLRNKKKDFDFKKALKVKKVKAK